MPPPALTIQDRFLALLAACDDYAQLLAMIRSCGDMEQNNLTHARKTPEEAFAFLHSWCRNAIPSFDTMSTIARESAHFRTNAKRNTRERLRQRRRRALAKSSDDSYIP